MMRAAGAVLFALFVSGCAQVREISGGPKDEAGPSLVSASPVAGSLRFVGGRFALRFDERVQVKRPAGGLLVSPPLDPPPVIKLTGAREVEVSWSGPLRPGTTYSFALGEAIQDLTEGNPAAGLTYIFSTGDALDSLTMRRRCIQCLHLGTAGRCARFGLCPGRLFGIHARPARLRCKN